MRDNPLDYDPHEACRQEMRRIDQEWRERYDNQHTIRHVLEECPGGYRVLQISKIEWTDRGMIVWVR